MDYDFVDCLYHNQKRLLLTKNQRIEQMLRKSIQSFCSLKFLSPYKVLNVKPDATQQQIKAKYYELAQKYHPDHNPGFSQKFKQVNEAYNLIKDPEKRRELDQILSTKGTPVYNKSDYSSTRQNYGNAYEKQQQQLQKQYNRRKSFYSGKPYFSGVDNSGAGINFKDWQSQRRPKNARLKQQQQNIRLALTICLALVGVFGVVELVFWVYDFNTQGHKQDEKLLRQQKLRRLT